MENNYSNMSTVEILRFQSYALIKNHLLKNDKMNKNDSCLY